jgi:hypothetical protein
MSFPKRHYLTGLGGRKEIWLYQAKTMGGDSTNAFMTRGNST